MSGGIVTVLKVKQGKLEFTSWLDRTTISPNINNPLTFHHGPPTIVKTKYEIPRERT